VPLNEAIQLFTKLIVARRDDVLFRVLRRGPINETLDIENAVRRYAKEGSDDKTTLSV